MENVKLDLNAKSENIEIELGNPTLEINLTGGARGLKGDIGPQGPQGEQGIQGEKGDSGVWVGSETPPDGYDVWINDDGTPSTVPTKLSDLDDDSTHRTVTDTEKANWNNKVDSVSGKGLSTNDFTTSYKNNVDSNTSARHTHSNKTILDGISSTDVSNWHTHSNKTVLDGISSNDITNWNNNTATMAVQDTAPTDANIKLWVKPDTMVQSPSNIINMIYPVGSYYETTDTNFNPNVSWGGTWVLEEDGAVLVSKSSTSGSIFNSTVGTTVGAETHTLTTQEMPSHNHTFGYKFASTPSFTGEYGAYLVAGSNNTAIQDKGGGQAHSIVQPSKIINRWHRTA